MSTEHPPQHPPPYPPQYQPPYPRPHPGPSYADRHIGPDAGELATMLARIGVRDLDELAARAVPASIRADIGPGPSAGSAPAVSEDQALEELRGLARQCRVDVQMIGMGYHDCLLPAVITRNVLENPAWYTAYTPYQPEIAQGRLEALLNFQTMVSDLTGLPIANASMLDEGTAAAEAMALARRVTSTGSRRFVVDADTLPQTISVIRTRAEPLGVEVVIADLATGLPAGDSFAVLFSYPGSSGAIRDLAPWIEQAHSQGAIAIVAADLLALTLFTEPGAIGADIVVGTTQRFGLPLGFGGPHAGYFAVRADLQRQLPGRLVGVSQDADGNRAYRLALQTREQHIRRERATSNLCTASVLVAIVAALYAVHHGPQGLADIARRIHGKAATLAAALRSGGVHVEHDVYFDTLRLRIPGRAGEVAAAAKQRGINLWQEGDDVTQVSISERTTDDHLRSVLGAFGVDPGALDTVDPDCVLDAGSRLIRTTTYLTHPVFSRYRSETAMVRYLRRLAEVDLALDRTMIPLGSCTMKLSSAASMSPLTWPEFAGLHPFAPAADAAGLRQMIGQLEEWICRISGYSAVSLQPNAGSQGELAGLLAIRAFHRANGQEHRSVCLIPASAHGTNAASAVMSGMSVVVIRTDDDGSVDLADLREKIDRHRLDLAAVMITYPSTHGVYEETVSQVGALTHAAGGQVYVDGANFNALAGVARPGEFGGDVSHFNLHKTFGLPHGGGGPGVGPVAVAAHLAPYLPGHPHDVGAGAVSSAPWGSASLLPVAWMYLRLMGAEGVRRATLTAVAAANYLARRLHSYYPVLYTGRTGFVAHECILDLRSITRATGITVDDVAKRLMDHGFHAPSVSFPVAGTMMVEPTESENLDELDRFCAAMISIKGEIDRVASGEWDGTDNPLRQAPHTAACLTAEWRHPYSRAEAVYPPGVSPEHKYFPPVRRIDGAYGDRNLMCSCPAPESYESPG